MEKTLTPEEVVEEIVGRVLLADTPANDCLVPAMVRSAVFRETTIIVNAVPVGFAERQRLEIPQSFEDKQIREGACLPGFIIPSEITEDKDGVIRIRGSLPNWAGGEDRTQIFLPNQ